MAGGDLTPLVVTYTYICFSICSRKGRPLTFNADGMLPYRYFYHLLSRAFGGCLNTRLLSTHGLSTSELLRTP